MPDTVLPALLPCPFCGSDEAVIDESHGTYEPGCAHCGVRIGQYSSRRSAASNWNMRPEAACARAAVPASEPVAEVVSEGCGPDHSYRAPRVEWTKKLAYPAKGTKLYAHPTAPAAARSNIDVEAVREALEAAKDLGETTDWLGTGSSSHYADKEREEFLARIAAALRSLDGGGA